MKKLTRRQFIERGGLAAGASAIVAPTLAGADTPQPRKLGAAIRPYGERSRFEKSARSVGRQTAGVQAAASRTPLHDSVGIITPSSSPFRTAPLGRSGHRSGGSIGWPFTAWSIGRSF